MANSYLTRSVGTPTNIDKYTFSVWVKRADIGAGNSKIFSVSSGSAYGEEKLEFNQDDLIWRHTDTSGNTNWERVTDRKFRDSSAWYNIVVAYDSSLGTAGDRCKMYINGVQETSFSSSSNPSQNADTYINKNGSTLYIGRLHSSASQYFSGYMSHMAFVDGSALTPTSFGETDSTSGIWKFKSPSGITWGNNGFHLKFENSGALGTDSSGNGNNLTVSGNLKQALDTPSNSYCTLNPLSTDSGVTLSNGNTESDYDASVGNAKGTLGFSSGKWYWEVKIATASSDYPMLGIGSLDEAQMQKPTGGSYPGGFTNSYGGYGNGNVYANGSNTGSQSFSWATNDIIGIAVDLDSATKTIKWYKNGNSTAIASYNITNAVPFTVMDYNGAEGSVNLQYNFGNGFFGTTAITSAGSNGNGSLFEYDVPSGYYALNTKNINTYG